MLNKFKGMILVALLGVAALGLACDGSQTVEANKLVAEGNTIVNKYNDLVGKRSALMTDLFGENLLKAEDLEKYKTDNKAKYDELIKSLDETEKTVSEAAAKFEEASKLKVDDKFKEYLDVTAQEMKKRAQVEKDANNFAKAYWAEENEEKSTAMITDYNTKSAATKKEVDDLAAKGAKIMKDNPNIFAK